MGTVVVLGISGGRRRQRDQRLRVPRSPEASHFGKSGIVDTHAEMKASGE